MPQSDFSPSELPFAITPSDGADVASHRSILIAVGGNINVTRLDGVTEVQTVPAGMYPARIRRLLATSTTATGFVGFR